MKKIIHCSTIIALIIVFTGCASIHQRSRYYSPPERYPGVEEDISAMRSHDSISRAWGPVASFIATATSIIDIPFSFVLDTILLPYDLMRSPEKVNTEDTPGNNSGDPSRDK